MWQEEPHDEWARGGADPQWAPQRLSTPEADEASIRDPREPTLPLSTTHDEYPPHSPQARNPPRQKLLPLSRPFYSPSVYKQDFVRHDVKPPKVVRRPPPSPSKEPMGISSYSEHFGPGGLGASSATAASAPSTAAVPDWQSRELMPAPFYGASRYATDFVPFSLGDKRPCRFRKAKWQLDSSRPFDGATTYGSSFREHSVPTPRPSPRVGPPPSLPFTARTEHQHQYVAHRQRDV